MALTSRGLLMLTDGLLALAAGLVPHPHLPHPHLHAGDAEGRRGAAAGADTPADAQAEVDPPA